MQLENKLTTDFEKFECVITSLYIMYVYASYFIHGGVSPHVRKCDVAIIL